jgi:hypothetical protein
MPHVCHQIFWEGDVECTDCGSGNATIQHHNRENTRIIASGLQAICVIVVLPGNHKTKKSRHGHCVTQVRSP